MRAWVASGVLAMMSIAACGVALATGFVVGRDAGGSSTLARVRAVGVLGCGIDQEEVEYSTSDDHGSRAAFDADLCHAVAVAVLGERGRVRVVDYPDDLASMAGLHAGEVEMVTLRIGAGGFASGCGFAKLWMG